jgi:hypothetical protein
MLPPWKGGVEAWAGAAWAGAAWAKDKTEANVRTIQIANPRLGVDAQKAEADLQNGVMGEINSIATCYSLLRLATAARHSICTSGKLTLTPLINGIPAGLVASPLPVLSVLPALGLDLGTSCADLRD